MNRNLDSNSSFPATRSHTGCTESLWGAGFPEAPPAVAAVLAGGAR
jgi:hypothetical protein